MIKQLFSQSPLLPRRAASSLEWLAGNRRRSDYPLASVTHGEDGWEQKKERVEALLRHAVLQTGENSGWASGVWARVGGGPVTYYYTATSRKLWEAFVELERRHGGW